MRKFLLLGLPIIALPMALLTMADSIRPEPYPEGFSSTYEAYALFFGLNPTNAIETALDYDGDDLSNIEESKKLTDPFCWDTDRDGFSDLVDSNAVSRAYIHWGDPMFTTGEEYEYAHPDWLLGAYKSGGEWLVDSDTTQSCWHVSANKDGDIASLNIDLDRAILTNNLRYAIHYSAGGSVSAMADSAGQPVPPSDPVGQSASDGIPSLYLNLLDTNGLVVAENLHGNLMAGSNADAVIILDVPTAKFTDAAVIQLRCGNGGTPLIGDRSENDSGEIFIYEGLVYIDEDGDGLDADQERQVGASDYSIDSNNNGTNDYDECFNTGSFTNTPDGEGDDDKYKEDKEKGIIYVDQAKGDDNLTGYSCDVSGRHGPKKTVRGGLSIAETNNTIIIKSGTYNENLNIQGKDVKVFIE